MTENEARNLFVNTARAWIGRNEDDGTFKVIIDLYNTRAKPLPRGYAVKYTDAWCATYVSAVALKIGYEDIIPPECGCEEQIKLFMKLGSWVENDNYIPQPGDIIYYDWEARNGDAIGVADHVGIVEKVTGTLLQIIEGNKAESVSRRTIRVGDNCIRGFATPNYKSKVVEDEVIDTTKVLFNDKEVEVSRILQDGQNYVKLRDCEKFGLKVSYDAVKKLPTVKT